MRTGRFRQILEILGGIDPKRFASEKQHIEKRERRFVGFIKPSTGALFAFSRQIKGGSQCPISRGHRYRCFAPKTSDAADARIPPTVLSVGTGLEAVCAQIWKK